MRISDWSSDVCSADLGLGDIGGIGTERTELVMLARIVIKTPADAPDVAGGHEARQRHVARPTRPDVAEALDRKSAVSGKSVSGRVGLGGRRIIQKQKT